MEEREEIKKILIKLDYKAKKEAIKNLKKEYKGNPEMLGILKKFEKGLPSNV